MGAALMWYIRIVGDGPKPDDMVVPDGWVTVAMDMLVECDTCGGARGTGLPDWNGRCRC